MKWRNLGACALLLLGLTQMTGDLLNNRALKGIGAAIAIAPCPKVFCDINGLEPFASTFVLTTQGDETISQRITPELYARLRGPYNRRNVYGAVVAAAPLLPSPMRQRVFQYAFASNGPLTREFGLGDASRITLTLRTNTRDRDDVWTFECKR
jgi:hypothetical protein